MNEDEVRSRPTGTPTNLQAGGQTAPASPRVSRAGFGSSISATAPHWHIHGRCVNLTSIQTWHPGGRAILKLVQGDNDVTATFESYHAFASPATRAVILRKLGSLTLPSCGAASVGQKRAATWRAGELFATVRSRVAAEMGRHHKATAEWWFKTLGATMFLLVLWVELLRGSVQAGAVLGLAQWILAYIALHDACHFAVFVNPKHNLMLSAAVCTLVNLWHPRRWLYHHAVRHHAFTGDDKLDPDRRHLQPFIDKRTPSASKAGLFVFITMVFPGLWLGQALSYLGWWGRKRLWGMKDVDDPHVRWLALGWAMRLGTAWYNPLGTFIWTVASNVIYALTILPDHDTATTRRNSATHHTADWGEQQVRHSANFGGVVCWWLFGGINYQIEHHLFPSLNHVHHRRIAPIVKQVCDEFDVPYAHLPTVLGAYLDCVRVFTDVLPSHNCDPANKPEQKLGGKSDAGTERPQSAKTKNE